MSVPKSRRTEAKMHVHVELRRVLRHTLAKTRNTNKFGGSTTYELVRDERGMVTSIVEHRSASREAIAHRLDHAAIAASECAWRANDIRVGDHGEGYEERRRLQEESIRHLGALLMLIDVARAECGLSGKEVKYWSDLTRQTRGLVRKWRDGDARRYRACA